eukprot:TRINITY_DN7370_c0_g1_i1.p3 TRINITY_DN7370_c0_g1~~TRINITY_DN7370_c0_g1_i1.p3  ORF type:complete len:177 (-),score=69.45 TRINITY_DN7370_c0_g1_i1:142-672(-)
MSDLAADFALLSNATTFIASGATTSSEADAAVAAAFSRLVAGPIDEFLDRATESSATLMLKMFTCEAIIFLWNENTTAVEPEGPNFALAAQLFAELDRSTESVSALVGAEKKEITVASKFNEALTVFLDVPTFHSSMLYAMGYCDPPMKLTGRFVELLQKYAATEEEAGFLENLRE